MRKALWQGAPEEHELGVGLFLVVVRDSREPVRYPAV